MSQKLDLILGDCLPIMQDMPSGSIDAVIADPPYSSGGFTRSDRGADPAAKYVQTGIELDPAYFEVARRRIEHAQLQPALLEVG